MRPLLFLLCLAALAGCAPRHKHVRVHPTPRYVQEPAWQGEGGVWFYPQERYTLEQTGLASVYPARGHARLTTNGELFSQTALAAAHQTSQLPAIARITNLENGLQILVRLNDRGPTDPHRMLQLTRHAADLLQISSQGVAPIRLEIDEAASHALTESLGGGAPKLNMQAIPRAEVTREALGGTQLGYGSVKQDSALPPNRAATSTLPDQAMRVTIPATSLWIRAGEFSRGDYAQRQSASLAPYGQVEQIRSGRAVQYRVKAGPFSSISQADAALDQALRAGITDAHIVVE